MSGRDHRRKGEREDTRTAPDERGPKRFRTLLVPVDLTPTSDRVVGRLALLPLAKDARVTLLHVVPGSLPTRDQRRAERDAKKALADEMLHLRKSLRIYIEPVVKVGAAAKQIAACANAAKAELIVMGRGGGRALREAFIGSTAERVIRQSKLPVLVVRLPPRAAYGRPALALDLDQAAHHVIGLMLRILRPPRPRVAIIHAFDDPYRSWVYSNVSEDAEERQDELRLKAFQALAKLFDTSLAQAKVLRSEVPVSKIHIRYGSPRIVIEKAVANAATDLLVLGTRGHSGVAHALLGTVAGDVLRAVACDVLVVPPTR